MARILIVAWKPGMQKISLVDFIRRHSDLGLAAAKRQVDCLLTPEGATISVVVDDDKLEQALSELAQIGVEYRVEYDA